MLVNCNSCQKKFTVPDSAITESGRLLQCGSCGNKWTQYPVKHETVKEEKLKKEKAKPTINKIKQAPNKSIRKNLLKKQKREINLYSEEYLQKKHGLTIGNNLDSKKIKSNKNNKSNYGFFSYLIILTIFIITLFAALNLTKDIIIVRIPSTESYIYSLYEILEILKAIIIGLIS